MASIASILGYVALGTSVLALSASLVIARKSSKRLAAMKGEQEPSPDWLLVRYGKSGYIGGEFIDIREEDAE